MSIKNYKARSIYTLIVLVWKKVVGTTYKIEYKKTTDIDYIELESDLTSSTYLIEQLESGESYDIRITDNIDLEVITDVVVTTVKYAPCETLEILRKEWNYNDADFVNHIVNLESQALAKIKNKVTDIYKSIKDLNDVISMINNYVMSNLKKDSSFLNQDGSAQDEIQQFYIALNNIDNDEEYQKKNVSLGFYLRQGS